MSYPFSAVVGQADLKLALLLNAVEPAIGGVLVRGQKGTAKSTAVRAMAALLPPIEVLAGDPYHRAPRDLDDDPRVPPAPVDAAVISRPTPLVELPVGASEDRLVGSLDLERALVDGVRAFEPGLLATAHRGVLYVDEVNLLTDHLVDLLLDAAAMGVNHVEREGVSVRHASRFLLVGTMNPEEGELRPQLLDRFGLTVTVAAPTRTRSRTEVVRRRLAHDADPAGFAERYAASDRALAERVVAARDRLPAVRLPDAMLARIGHICGRFSVDGLRADIVIARAACTHAAWQGRDEVELDDIRIAALLALPHRRRRGPLEEPGIDRDELERYLHEPLDPDEDDEDDDPDGGPDGQDGPDEDPGPDGGDQREPSDDDEEAEREDEQRSPPDGGPEPGADHPSGAGPDGGARDERDRDMHDTDERDLDHGGPDDRTDDDRPGDDGAASDADDGGPGTVHAVGTAGRPPLLTVPGRGQGARGRRSASAGGHGTVVGTRRRHPGEAATDLSLGATLRAAAPHQRARGRDGVGLIVRGEDLHTRVRQGRESNLVVFVVDASGSMGARQRMQAVKGAIRALLLDAYQRRDRLALVTFRGSGAQLALPPTSSVDVADRRLAELPTGGRTPLAAGLARARELVAAESARARSSRPLLVVLTDGRANVGGPDPRAASRTQARALVARGVSSVVVDTEDGFLRLGLADDLAEDLQAPVLRLDDLGADALTGVVRDTVQTRR